MAKKLDAPSQDIYSLLEKQIPETLRHHEICDSLFKFYSFKYKDKKGFGVAISKKLNLLVAAEMIKHEGIMYGSLKSDFHLEVKRNIFPGKIQKFLELCDYLNFPELLIVKEEVLRLYPNEPFREILRKNIEYLRLAKPKLKGIIQVLKDFEGDKYEKKTDTCPRYWGTLEGEIIKAIVSARVELTWNEIQEKTNADKKSLDEALSKLLVDGAITWEVTDRKETYRVSNTLWYSYKNYLRSAECKKELEDWINQWKELRKLDFTLDCDHFFLEGRHLDDFTKELISHAKSNVLVVNPFIEYCDLSNTLSDVKKRRISVQIITREPHDKYADKLKKKQEYLSQLVNEGVDLQYNNKVHAKIVVVDNIIAIVSSMNFYPESSAGVSWEAGLISLQSKTVESIIDSIKKKSE